MDYKLMCFPCLRKKKKLHPEDYTSSSDFDDQSKYVVDKYMIRKIPSYEEQINKLLDSEPTDDAEVKLDSDQDLSIDNREAGDYAPVEPNIYSVQKITSCLPVTAHNARSIKDKPRPADILDSTSQASSRKLRKSNYVAIPSKASAYAKDIMITKREITNQYLNNFSSVFVDNLKDQIPKDPENLPKLGRPYTSAIKELRFVENVARSRCRRESCRKRVEKIIYALPDGRIVEAGCDADDSSPEASENDCFPPCTQSSQEQRDFIEIIPSCFKRMIKHESNSEELKNNSNTQSSQAKQPSSKQVTYEDIQALDVGYEFPNSEKFGVKPKMTRIRITNLDSDRSKEASPRPLHAALVESEFTRRTSDKAAQKSSTIRTPNVSHVPVKQLKTTNFRNRKLSSHFRITPGTEGTEEYERRLRFFFAETHFMPVTDNYESLITENSNSQTLPIANGNLGILTETEKKATTNNLFYSFTEGKGKTENENDYHTGSLEMNRHPSGSRTAKTSERSFSKFSYRPSSASTEKSFSGTASTQKCSEEQVSFKPQDFSDNIVCRNRSLESLSTQNQKESLDQLRSKTRRFLMLSDRKSSNVNIMENESLYSRDSRTSSLIVTPASSEQDRNKKATLRWKIVIKHLKENEITNESTNQKK